MMLACTPMSFSVRDFRSATTSASGPDTASAGDQSAVSGLDVTTYLGTVLMKSANGCSSEVGQYADHSS